MTNSVRMMKISQLCLMMNNSNLHNKMIISIITLDQNLILKKYLQNKIVKISILQEISGIIWYSRHRHSLWFTYVIR